MKKLKLIAIIAMTLCIVMALSSCGRVTDLSKIYNVDYDNTSNPYTTAQKISELDDYEPLDNSDCNYFEIFTKNEKDETITAIYSFYENKVVKTLVSDEDVTYEVTAPYYAPICLIKETKASKVFNEDPSVTYTYIDATGNEILTTRFKATYNILKSFSEYIFSLNSTLYSYNKDTGAVTKKSELPGYISIDDLVGVCGDYYYVLGDEFTIIYDSDFLPIVSLSLPSYADNYNIQILNNGNLFVQYAIALPDDAKDYDFYSTGEKSISLGGDSAFSSGYLEDGMKYDLVSKIITVKGKEKELDLDYYVDTIIPNFYGYEENEKTQDNIYTDKFENLALIVKIQDKKLDLNEFNYEYVLMSNSAKIGKSLMLIDGQYPENFKMINKNLYWIDTTYGSAFVDAKGKVQFHITSNVRMCGEYLYTSAAIYDLSFNKVYDLVENNATVAKTIDGTIFVRRGDITEEYSIISFRNGKLTNVFEYDEDEYITFNFTDYGYYITEADDDEYTHTYYTVYGDMLFKTSGSVNNFRESLDSYIIMISEEDNIEYYLITK